jgi:hypothetical protein
LGDGFIGELETMSRRHRRNHLPTAGATHQPPTSHGKKTEENEEEFWVKLRRRSTAAPPEFQPVQFTGLSDRR